jgi:hypothetical protein
MAQITNSGFETWITDSEGNLNPQGWGTSNDALSERPPSVVKGTPYEGAFSMQIKKHMVATNMYVMGFAYSGFHIATKPNYLSLYAKWDCPDGCDIIVVVSKGDSSIGAAAFQFTGAQSNFTFTNIPIAYASNTVPDSALITISAGSRTGFNTVSTTTLLVDKLTFTTTSNVEFLKHGESSINAYPNPVNDFVNVSFDLSHSEKVDINILDLFGRVVMIASVEKRNTGHNITRLNLGDLPPGVYYCNVSGESYSSNQKIVIQR